MEQSKLLAVLVSTAGVSMLLLSWFVGLPDNAPTVPGAVVLTTQTNSTKGSFPRPRLIPPQSMAADVATVVSGETATTSTSVDSADTAVVATAVPVVTNTPTAVRAPAKVVETTRAATNQSAPPTAPGDFERALATRIHELTNEERVKQSLPPYTYDGALAGPAYAYSTTMLQQDFFSHTDPSGCGMTCRFAKTRYSALAWGENLALWESSYAPSVEEVAEYFVHDWKKSAGHRENLFSSTYTNEGVGVAVVGNKIIATVRFADPK